jgi:RNA polymerase sigma-70 factor (ECF subfamily)
VVVPNAVAVGAQYQDDGDRGGPVDVSDAELVARSTLGSPAVFGELVTRHGAALHAYLARRTGRGDADDLLGELWLRAFESRTSYDTRWADARPWLYGIARNTLRAHWRRALRSNPSLAGSDSDPWPEADSRIDATSQRGALLQALAELSEDDREVLLLVTWEQLSPAEAAIALAIPPGTVRSRLHRARASLRKGFASRTDTLTHSLSKEA